MKDIKEINKLTRRIIAILRAEAISHNDDWKKYSTHRNLKEVDEMINQLWPDLKVLEDEHSKLLANQKPDDYNDIKNELSELKKILENKTSERVQTDLNKISELEKKLSELTDKNAQLQQQNADSQKQSEDALKNKSPESSFPIADTESKAKKRIQTELDKFNSIKIEKISDDECSNLLNKFKTMKNWILTGSDEESKAAINKQSELKKITNELSLENNRRKWKHKIDYALKDEYEYEEDEVGEQEEHLERIVLKNKDLTKIEYIDYEITLREKTSKKALDDFGYKVVADIYEQRPKHKYIIEVLNWGKQAVENKDTDLAKEVLTDLEFIKKIERQVYDSKIVEVNRLKRNIESLFQQAQIVQTGK